MGNSKKDYLLIVEKFGKYIALTTLYTHKSKSEILSFITGKTALYGFVKALAYELEPRRITINLISPEMVDKPSIDDILEKVRLLSTAQDAAGTISFLASDKYTSNYLIG